MSVIDAIPPRTSAVGTIHEYRGAGGQPLRYRVVRAEPERQAIVYTHGIESHAGWFLPAAEGLRAHGFTTYLLDRRGSGLNREGNVGDAPSADALLEDVARFRAELGEHSLIGLSWGGKLALASALTDPAALRGLVLVTPGLVPRVDLTFVQKLRLLASIPFGGRAPIDIPIEPEMFTESPLYLDYIREDPLRLHRVTARFLLAGRELDRRIDQRIESLAVPTLLFLAGHDRIIDNERTRALLERAPKGRLSVRDYEHATHSIQFDDTEELVEDVRSFLEAPR